MTSDPTPPSTRTRVQRLPDRGRYDRGTIDAILDEALVAHVGFTTAEGPSVVPTACWREGDEVYVHGSSASRLVQALREGNPCCLCATLLDGVVFARSGFHQSVNYRSVVVYGTAREIVETDEKLAALEAFTNRIAPGRWEELRPPTSQELRATGVFTLPLDEASAKVRTGGPVDDEPDYALPIWAGVLPLGMAVGDPIADPKLTSEIAAPDAITHLRQQWRGA